MVVVCSSQNPCYPEDNEDSPMRRWKAVRYSLQIQTFLVLAGFGTVPQRCWTTPNSFSSNSDFSANLYTAEGSAFNRNPDTACNVILEKLKEFFDSGQRED